MGLVKPHRGGDGSSGERRARWCLWSVLVLCCLPAQAYAAQVLGVQVRREGMHFLIGMQVEIAAPPPAVFRALRDYQVLPRYSPGIRAVRVEPTSKSNRVRLYATMHVCVLFFCRTMHEEQIMIAAANAHGGVLRAVLVPRGSDFKSGRGRWTVRPCPAGPVPTCMDVRIELVPAFWVPPLIGPWLIRRRMYQEARRTSSALERLARKLLASTGAMRGEGLQFA